jgi:hypothetical protein
MILDDLIKARELISDSAHWCRKAMARNQDGEEVHALDEDAVQWCALGAFNKVCEGKKSFDILYEVFEIDTLSEVVRLNDNDGGGHEKVMALYDKAIEIAKIRGI